MRPCLTEAPSFIKLQTNYGAKGLRILGLNYNDEPAELAAFAARQGLNYPVGPGPEALLDVVPGGGQFPTTVFVGRDGTVRMTTGQVHDDVFLEAVVAELLAEPAPAVAK